MNEIGLMRAAAAAAASVGGGLQMVPLRLSETVIHSSELQQSSKKNKSRKK